MIHGIGGTILEDLVYDENGQLLTTTFLDYLLPLSTDVPPIDSLILEEAPSPLNPLGIKGPGELGMVGVGAALANAVSNALAPLGVQVRELPLSQYRVRALVSQKGYRPCNSG
ncbi:MAG: molybdopterin cofactor-binding domain-containing protein, partial [Dehalococcoidia bacterium]